MARNSRAKIEQANGAWQFPKGADIESQHGHAAAQAFFSSRLINQIEAMNEASEEISNEASEEISDAEIEAQRKAADEAFERAIEERLAQMGASLPRAKKEYIHRSSVIRPTKRVWAIADEMIAKAEAANLPRPSRGEIIEECIRRGIASGTSATQYQAWKKAMGY